MRCSSPTAATAASSCSMPTTAPTSVTGSRYGEKAAGAAPGPYDPNAPPAKSFRDVTCVEIARDGMVYVCDKSSNRIQVFDKTGKFVKEGFIAKNTLRRRRRRQLRRAAERGGLGVGRRVLERPAAALPLRRRRPEQESARPAARHARPKSARSAAAAGIRVSSWRSAASRPTRRATCTRARRTTASACRSSLPGQVSDQAIEEIRHET